MYEVGQLVVYGVHGVCRILELEEKRVDRKTIPYFVLEPMDQPGTKYYVPSQNEAALAKLRPLIDAEKLRALLQDKTAETWIPEDNRRKLRYKEILTGVHIVDVMAMLRAVYAYRRDQAEMGRKLHQCDEMFLHDAEKMLTGEIALVLQMPKEDAIAHLRTQLIA